MAGLASNPLNVWLEIYDEQSDVGGRGVPEILVKEGEDDESASALNSTATILQLSSVRSRVMRLGDIRNLENMNNPNPCLVLLKLKAICRLCF